MIALLPPLLLHGVPHAIPCARGPLTNDNNNRDDGYDKKYGPELDTRGVTLDGGASEHGRYEKDRRNLARVINHAAARSRCHGRRVWLAHQPDGSCNLHYGKEDRRVQ